MLLCVNADDAGLHARMDDAILRCAAAGVLRNATVVANGPCASSFVRRARELGLDLGLHFNLTAGRALAGPARTLTDAHGNFDGDKRALWRRASAGALDPAELRAELEAQWDALGFEPSHLDGHNHVHVIPAVQEALAGYRGWVRASWEAGDDARPDGWPEEFDAWAEAVHRGPLRTCAFRGFRFSREPTRAVLLAELSCDDAVVELMAHPGARPGSAFAGAPARDEEAAVLADPGLRAVLRDRGVEAVTFTEAAGRCG